eukprot:TRINITY_DN12729_c0_g1_i5.p1 TRINITY_DN12729_c0_g1~~TRINITY_DN12729_c0_g1_i5.p1  ORF type:complete len:795 (-),score=177.33 TRINITY_DN12729_c0_g1_i5:182-2521(-)
MCIRDRSIFCVSFALATGYLRVFTSDGNEIPLKSIDYSIQAIDGLMSVCITQMYTNNRSHPIDATYTFPVNYHMATTNLTVLYSHDNSVLVARLAPKEKAREYYERAREAGEGAVYMGFDGVQKDMLSIDLGNVLSGETLEVKITFVEKLKTEDLSWAIRIPTTFIPPYPSDGQTSRSSQASVAPHGAYSMTLNLVVQSLSPITRLISPSHDIVPTFDSDNTRAVVRLKNEYESPDRDIVVLYRTSEIQHPQLVVQKSSKHDTYAAVISFLPFAEYLSGLRLDTNRTQRYYSAKKYLKAKSEFVFLIDCSGSMMGRINQAREAAKLFLKSLPPDSYFTFVFFGSNYQVASPGTSVKYTEETIAEAWNYLSQMDASMGGTELYQAMEYVLNMPRIDGYMRNVLVMTDGEVTDPQGTINLVKAKAGSTYVSAIGIGAGASRHLVQGLAEAGRGASHFITEDETITPKVIEALNNMCVDRIQDIQIQWPTKPQVSYEAKTGFYGQPLVAAGIFRERPWGVAVISGYRSDNGKYFEKTFDLDSMKYREGEEVYQLALRLALNNGSIEDRETIRALSMKYSVLSDETAFIAVKLYPEQVDREDVKEVEVPIMQTREIGRGMVGNGQLFYMDSLDNSRGAKKMLHRTVHPDANYMYEPLSADGVNLEAAEVISSTTKKDKKDLMELIALQRPDGSFELKPEIIKKYLNRSVEDIKKELKDTDLLHTNEKALSTVLMLIILDKEYSGASEVSLVRTKAIDWLDNNGISYEAAKLEFKSINNAKTDL